MSPWQCGTICCVLCKSIICWLLLYLFFNLFFIYILANQLQPPAAIFILLAIAINIVILLQSFKFESHHFYSFLSPHMVQTLDVSIYYLYIYITISGLWLLPTNLYESFSILPRALDVFVFCIYEKIYTHGLWLSPLYMNTLIFYLEC